MCMIPVMLCLSILISLARLPGSFEVQHGYAHFGEHYHSTADHGHDQNMAFPQRQGLSHLQVSPSRRAESRIGPAEDYPQQPITSPYQFQQFTPHPHWPGADSFPPTHPPNDLTQAQAFRAQNNPSYPIPQQSTSSHDRTPNPALKLPSTYESTIITSDGLLPYQREWDIVDLLLMHEGTNMPPDLLPLIDSPSQGSSKMPSASDMSAHGSSGSRTPADHFQKLQNGLHNRNDFSQVGLPSTILSSGTPDSHFNRLGSFGQSSDNEGGSMTGFKRMRELDSTSVTQTENEDDRTHIRINMQKASREENHELDKTGEPSSKIQNAHDVSRSFSVSTASPHRLKMARHAAMLMAFEEWNEKTGGRSIGRTGKVQTVRHWLPVFEANFNRLQGNSEIKDKLAALFEQLWIIHKYLLYSYDYDILTNHDTLLDGQEHMLSWVANELSKHGASITSCESSAQNPPSAFLSELMEPILKFLKAPRETEHITITTKHTLSRITRESALACDLGCQILHVYYKTNNPKKWKRAFKYFPDIFGRLNSFISAVHCSNMREWTLLPSTNYRKLKMVPWSDNENRPASAPFDFSRQEFHQTCQERLQEVNVIFEKWSEDHEFEKSRKECPFHTDTQKQSLQDYAVMVATTQRCIIDEKVYKEHLYPIWSHLCNSVFQPPNQTCQNKEILAQIFQNLWTMHKWLLYSLKDKILEQQGVYFKGQQDMLRWVVNQLLKNKERLPDLGFPNQHTETEPSNFEEIEKLIINFIRTTAASKNDYILVHLRKKDFVVSSEDAQLCELAINILNLYYKSTNKVQWHKTFEGPMSLFFRLKRCIHHLENGTMKRFFMLKKWEVQGPIVPWNTFSTDEKKTS